jgi:hypothetical protein
VVTDATVAQTELLWGVELELVVAEAAYSQRAAVLTAEPDFVAYYNGRFGRALQSMNRIVDGLMAGSDDLGLGSVVLSSRTAYMLLLEDGCVSVPIPDTECALYGVQPFYGCNKYYDYNLCRLPDNNVNISVTSFAYGLVGTGLLPSIKAMLTAATAVLNRRREQLADFLAGRAAVMPIFEIPQTPSPSANAEEPQDFVNQMAGVYLAGGLEALSAGLYSEASAIVEADLGLDLAALLLSFVALLLIYFFWYKPMLMALDAEVKKTRSLLLLLPEEVVKSTPALVRAAGKFASSGAG